MKLNFRFLISATIVVFSSATVAAYAEDTPRSAMRKGLRSYNAGDYTNAVMYLEKTVLEFPEIGHYNLGNAHYRNGDFDAAADAYTEALRTTDLELQAKAYFNLGNSMLARTTILPGKDQINRAASMAFEAMGMYEKALLLNPDDLDAKQNFERAAQLRVHLEFEKGSWLFNHAESLLREFQAKDAQTYYRLAKNQFEHILENIDKNHDESRMMLPKTAERLTMLDKAVSDAESDLAAAQQFIVDYQYALAAERLTKVSNERKYAFNLKPDLKKEYDETARKNGEVIKIIEELSTLGDLK